MMKLKIRQNTYVGCPNQLFLASSGQVGAGTPSRALLTFLLRQAVRIPCQYAVLMTIVYLAAIIIYEKNIKAILTPPIKRSVHERGRAKNCFWLSLG